MLRKLFALAFLLIIIASCDTDTTDYGPIDKKIIEDYLADNNLTAQSTASGLYYIIEKPGGANHPNINSVVVANYKGYLTDGTVFDETKLEYAFGNATKLSSAKAHVDTSKIIESVSEVLNPKNIKIHNDKLHKEQAKKKEKELARKEKLKAITRKFNENNNS